MKFNDIYNDILGFRIQTMTFFKISDFCIILI